jgi:hypothetical protein
MNDRRWQQEPDVQQSLPAPCHSVPQGADKNAPRGTYGGLLRRDRRDGVAILRAQAAQHIEDLACLAHWLANITKGVGKMFQAPGVLSNVHVALDKIAKLSFKVHWRDGVHCHGIGNGCRSR